MHDMTAQRPETSSRLISPEEGYDLARFQRPGRRIQMGAEMARDAAMLPLGKHALQALPGPSTWLWYDYKRAYGFNPSLWMISFGLLLAEALGEKAAPEHIHQFSRRDLSQEAARKILATSREAAASG